MFESFFSDRAFHSASGKAGGRGGGYFQLVIASRAAPPHDPSVKTDHKLSAYWDPIEEEPPTLGLSPANHAQQWRLEFTFSLPCKSATKNTRQNRSDQQKIREFAIILFGTYYRAKIEAIIHYFFLYLFLVAASLFQSRESTAFIGSGFLIY